jgi:hypothetical protein
MSNSKIATVSGTIAMTIGIVGLLVHGDAFIDCSLIGNPLAAAALSPLGVRDLDGAVVQSMEGMDGMGWLVGVAAAANDGELQVAYSLIDAGAESLGNQLRAIGASSRLPLLYVLKAYMYLGVTPWWLVGSVAGGGAWLRAWGKANPWR